MILAVTKKHRKITEVLKFYIFKKAGQNTPASYDFPTYHSSKVYFNSLQGSEQINLCIKPEVSLKRSFQSFLAHFNKEPDSQKSLNLFCRGRINFLLIVLSFSTLMFLFYSYPFLHRLVLLFPVFVPFYSFLIMQFQFFWCHFYF